MRAVPVELKTANAFVEALHRHHDPVYRDKFRLGCEVDGKMVGVVQVARPVARGLDDGKTVEVVRLCTDGTPHVCSFLYARAAREERKRRKADGRKIVCSVCRTYGGTMYKRGDGYICRDCKRKEGNWYRYRRRMPWRSGKRQKRFRLLRLRFRRSWREWTGRR